MPKFDLSFRTPYLNAAGSLGFYPDPHGPVDLAELGAFFTNPVSLGPRTPARGVRCLPYPGGFLLHTGFPNPGLSAVLRRAARRWEHSPLPVVVHILAAGMRRDALAELAAMVQRLERSPASPALMGIEVGLPPDAVRETTSGVLQSVAETVSGELPVILRLPLDRAQALLPAVEAAVTAGVAALSLGPPRGALAGSGDHPTRVHGRLYGPAIYPQALAVVEAYAQAGLPVIGAGGIYSRLQADEMLAAGALAVQLDSVLWRGGF
jgi:dihydroorotate dehydrogenase (NAD+) catalytic subunit